MTENAARRSMDEPLPTTLSGFETVNRYWDEQHNIFSAKIGPGEYYVSSQREMITTVLGSCVSVCIHDPVAGIGGMNHFMLPDSHSYDLNSWQSTPVSDGARYGNIAMERLINTIIINGGTRENLEMKVFGGSKLMEASYNIGFDNIVFVKQYIASEGFAILAEDTGGIYPRKLQYFPTSGRARVKKLYSMKNTTLVEREAKYADKLQHREFTGKISIFK